MTMGYRSVGGEEVGVRCGGMQRCCEGARPGVVSAEHGSGSGEYQDKQSRRYRAPIVIVAAAHP